MSISLGRWMDLQMIILLRDQWYKHPKFATDSVFDRKPERLTTILSKRSKPLNFFRVVLKKLLSTKHWILSKTVGPLPSILWNLAINAFEIIARLGRMLNSPGGSIFYRLARFWRLVLRITSISIGIWRDFKTLEPSLWHF